MIRSIAVDRFKNIQHTELELERINVLVGGNNEGKSSILQAVQMAVSVAQTAMISTNTPFKKGVLSTSISPEQLIYAPVRDVYSLGHGAKGLTGDVQQAIRVRISDDVENTTVRISKGKNKNIVVKIEGEIIGAQLQSLESPFSMYVPGLAGIPFEEQLVPLGYLRRAAAKGDSNIVLRNVLYRLNQNRQNWESFLALIRHIFPEIGLTIDDQSESTGLIEVSVSIGNGPKLPIDAMGTGILQAIQISAYIHFFKPKILLLDEPDAHLHPNKQRALAELLSQLVLTADTAVIIATHSRALMGALQNKAKFFRVRGGEALSDNFAFYTTLLELGALDDYDVLTRGHCKYVVLTEDSSPESQLCLKNILLASGVPEDEMRIYSYDSVSKIANANLFSTFLLDLHPNLHVIIHRDRDGMCPDEIELYREKIERDAPRLCCFVTAFNDLEMYCCDPLHVQAVLQTMGLSASLEELDALLEQALAERKEKSLQVLIDHRTAHIKSAKSNDGKDVSPGKIAADCTRLYEEGRSSPLLLRKRRQGHAFRSATGKIQTEYPAANPNSILARSGDCRFHRGTTASPSRATARAGNFRFHRDTALVGSTGTGLLLIRLDHTKENPLSKDGQGIVCCV